MKTIGIVLLTILIIIGFILLAGLIWMIGLGFLASIFQAPNLAIGYWESVAVALIFSVLFAGVGSVGGNK